MNPVKINAQIERLKMAHARALLVMDLAGDYYVQSPCAETLKEVAKAEQTVLEVERQMDALIETIT